MQYRSLYPKGEAQIVEVKERNEKQEMKLLYTTEH